MFRVRELELSLIHSSRPDCRRLLYGVWIVAHDLGCSEYWAGKPYYQFESRSRFNRQIGN